MANSVFVRPGVTGLTFTGPLLLSDGTAAAPSMAFASNPDTGFFGGTSIRASLDGTVYWGLFADEFQLKDTTTLNWSAATVAAASDLTLSREAAAVLQIGRDAAGVTDQMFKAPDRITSDGVGGNLTVAGGRNRGASAGGSLIFQTSPAAGAGVTGTLATALTIDSTKLATFVGSVDSAGYKVATVAGIDASITTAGLVGKTITVSKGIITAFA